jgi:hypothetical protein
MIVGRILLSGRENALAAEVQYPQEINAMIEDIKPVPDGFFTPR